MIVAAARATHGLVIVLAGLLGAIAWNLITWYFGLPSSSSHALIGGLVGAALAAGAIVHWHDDRRQGRHPDGALADRRLRPGVRRDAGDHVDLPAAQPAQGLPRLPDGADALGRRAGARPRPAGRPEDDGRDLPGAGHRRVRLRRRPAAAVGHRLRRAARSRSAPTPVAGGSCGPWAAGSSTSTRPAASPPSRSAPRCSTRRRSSPGPDLHHPRRSPRRSWAPAPPSASPPSAGAWPARSSTAWVLTFPMRRPRRRRAATGSCHLLLELVL